jgi:hypothetical protein
MRHADCALAANSGRELRSKPQRQVERRNTESWSLNGGSTEPNEKGLSMEPAASERSFEARASCPYGAGNPRGAVIAPVLRSSRPCSCRGAVIPPSVASKAGSRPGLVFGNAHPAGARRWRRQLPPVRRPLCPRQSRDLAGRSGRYGSVLCKLS